MLRGLFVLPLLLVAGSCDNVGRVWDPDVDPVDPGPGVTQSPIQVVPVGGTVRDARPTVRATYPSAGGWPPAVPVVVEFSESVNQASLLPTTATGTDGKVILRVKGTTQVLPCQYRFLAAGRLLVMRPVTELSNEQNPTYEVVLLPEARDCDGLRFDVPTGGKVLSEFQVNQDPSFTDGRILALFPRDNASDLQREGEVVVVFDRPANPATVVQPNLRMQTEAGVTVPGSIDLPLDTVGITDGRVALYRPNNPFPADGTFELLVTEDITFGDDGVLDYRGRTPFARFTTVQPAAPTKVELANPTVGYPDKINRTNALAPRLRVTMPPDTQVGDEVRGRIYGGDAGTEATGDLVYVERTATAAQAGAHTVDLDFTDDLGTLEDPALDEGALTFTAQVLRGSQASGFIHQPDDSVPLFDITRPARQRVGPPASADGSDLWIDLEFPAFFGTATEALGAATLVVGSNVAEPLYASDTSGRFLMEPISLGRRTSSLAFSLELVDRAGNLGEAPVTGSIAQRGLVTGALGGTLTVEAYDQATLAPLVGATVVLEPGVPTVPATGRRTAVTAADGRVVFSGITAASHTVTIVQAGYDLVTMYDTRAAFVSLPLRPATGATATFTGTATFVQGAGVTAVVGNTGLDSRSVLGVRTPNASPNTIPPVPVVPNRAQLVTAFAGTLEPTAEPVFAAHGCQLLGANLLTPTPPAAPAAGGAEATVELVLPPSVGQLAAFPNSTEDLTLATGLDLDNLVGGGPRVRIVGSLEGFEGQVLLGLGFATPGATPGVFAVQGSYSVPLLAGLGPFNANLWSVTEAQDSSGRISRRRQLWPVIFPFLLPGQVAVIPTITAPTGPVAGSPAVTFVDAFDSTIQDSLACADVVATDGNNRRWVLFAPDRDAAGGTDTVQFPDLTGVGAAGLAAGSWTLVVEARAWFTLTGSTLDDFVLTERVRREGSYARSAPVAFTIP